MTAETTPSPPSTADGRSPERRRTPFGNHVAKSVTELQTRLLTRRDSNAIATMARLRSAVTESPGAVYAVLDVTRVPGRFLTSQLDDAPTREEWAKHTALTLYACHQQSVSDPMHIDGIGFGTAVSRLARSASSPDAVRRRFAALGGAMTYTAVVYHARGLVGLLRQQRIRLDYGALADDLVQLQWVGGHDQIRARWGREFYRTFTTEAAASDNSEEQS